MSPLPRRPILLLYQLATGRHILRRLDELNRTQWLTRDQLMRLQRRRLHRLLCYAYEHVPYYHQLFDQHGFDPGEVLTDMSGFHRLPILTKAIIRENFDALLTTEPEQRKQLRPHTTSGSTGHPITVMQDRASRDYSTADLHRHLGWTGWKLGDVHCYIWGSKPEIATSKALRSRVMDWVLNRFITNAFALSDETMEAFAAEIRTRRPRVLRGYPASSYRFAQFVRDHHMDDIKFDAIMVGTETVYPEQRKAMEEVFGGRVFNRYGAWEAGGISCECDAHIGMHVSVETNYVEIMKDGQPAAPGALGDVVITNLTGYGMPFIRYRLGDIGAWSTHETCPCGRELPMMDLVQGRHIDTFKTRDGRVIWGALTDLLFSVDQFKQFQVVQKSLDLVVARVVKAGELDQATLNDIARQFKLALGENVEVRFEFPDEIPPQASGKYRYFISEIQDEPVTAEA